MNKASALLAKDEGQTTHDFSPSISLKTTSSHLQKATVIIPKRFVEIIREKTINLFKKNVNAQGFGSVPLSYLINNYGPDIKRNVKEFFLQYVIIDYLMQELHNRKITVAHAPRLLTTEHDEKGNLVCTFSLSIACPINIHEWRHYLFKPPRRKNYKDLDKQVAQFIKLEGDAAKKSNPSLVEHGDWACFEVKLLKEPGNLDEVVVRSNYWLNIASGDILHPISKELLAKQVGYETTTNEFMLSSIFKNYPFEQHQFALKLLAIAKGNTFSPQAFKQTFKLANKAAMHEKLIEIFSFRHDISQRRAIIEEMFQTLFSRHRFEVPKHFIFRKKEDLLHILKERPDFDAYRANTNFNRHLTMLAEKQLKEEIFIRQLAYRERVRVETKDIQNYLSLLSNQRSKEFIYFRSFLEGTDVHPTPIHESILKDVCLKEKTLNYVLYQLSR